MAFTLAHPAIVLPLLKINKRFVSATGLVVGSVAPDFEHFLRMSARRQHGHEVFSLLFIDLPLALLCSVLFHQVVKGNLIRNMPPFLQRRLEETRTFSFLPHVRAYPLIFLLSLSGGAFLHLLWDSFTHEGAYFVELLSFSDTMVSFRGQHYPLSYALQLVTSVAGMLYVAGYVMMLPADPAVRTVSPTWTYWGVVLGITAGIVGMRFRFGDPIPVSPAHVVVTTITALTCALFFAGLIRFRSAT